MLVSVALAVCVGLALPVDGPVVASFDARGPYEGHWGVDLAAEPGTAVRAAAAGTVTFAGVVVDNRTITLDHGGGLRTSYSYLSAHAAPRAGDRVPVGGTIGWSGVAHGRPALHFSVRLGDRYIDPAPLLTCLPVAPRGALRLAARWE